MAWQDLLNCIKQSNAKMYPEITLLLLSNSVKLLLIKRRETIGCDFALVQCVLTFTRTHRCKPRTRQLPSSDSARAPRRTRMKDEGSSSRETGEKTPHVIEPRFKFHLQGVKFLFFPIFSYFSQHTPIFPIFLAISSYFSYFLAILLIISKYLLEI